MSGVKPVSVVMMYLAKARRRCGSVHVAASCLREETWLSRRSRSLARAAQVRMACWKVSSSTWQRGQDRSGFSLNQEGWAAR